MLSCFAFAGVSFYPLQYLYAACAPYEKLSIPFIQLWRRKYHKTTSITLNLLFQMSQWNWPTCFTWKQYLENHYTVTSGNSFWKLNLNMIIFCLFSSLFLNRFPGINHVMTTFMSICMCHAHFQSVYPVNIVIHSVCRIIVPA